MLDILERTTVGTLQLRIQILRTQMMMMTMMMMMNDDEHVKMMWMMFRKFNSNENNIYMPFKLLSLSIEFLVEPGFVVM